MKKMFTCILAMLLIALAMLPIVAGAEESLADVEFVDGQSLRFSAQIGGELPQMTFTIKKTGESGAEYDRVYIYEATIAEKANPDKVFQTFTIKSEQLLDPDYFLHLVDLNFDGYLDIDISYYRAASNEVHRFYLWDMQLNQYVEAELGNLEVSWYTLFPEDKMIYRYYHDSAMTGISEVYQYTGSQLKLLRTVDTTGSSANLESHQLVVTDYSTGAAVVTRDEQLTADALLNLLQSGELDDLLWDGISHAALDTVG